MNRSARRAQFAAAVLALALTATVGLFASPVSAAPAPAQASSLGTMTSEVTGTFTNGTFTGTFVPEQFTTDGASTFATGVLSGTLVGNDGSTQAVSQPQTFQVNEINAIGCEVLDLVLGPLDLDLLGLVVHLDRVHLNITAVPGAGNLVGNLLCAIVGLLDGGPLASIVALLNQILALLRG